MRILYRVSSNNAAWADGSRWSLTSGGPAAGVFPGPEDTAIFDANSNMQVGTTATITQPVAVKRLILSGLTQTLQFRQEASLTLSDGGEIEVKTGTLDLQDTTILNLSNATITVQSSPTAGSLTWLGTTHLTGSTIFNHHGRSIEARCRFRGTGTVTFRSNGSTISFRKGITQLEGMTTIVDGSIAQFQSVSGNEALTFHVGHVIGINGGFARLSRFTGMTEALIRVKGIFDCDVHCNITTATDLSRTCAFVDSKIKKLVNPSGAASQRENIVFTGYNEVGNFDSLKMLNLVNHGTLAITGDVRQTHGATWNGTGTTVRGRMHVEPGAAVTMPDSLAAGAVDNAGSINVTAGSFLETRRFTNRTNATLSGAGTLQVPANGLTREIGDIFTIANLEHTGAAGGFLPAKIQQVKRME